MARGYGSVYLRGKTWTIDYTVDGRRMREAIGPNRRLAEMVLKKRVTEALENRWFDRRKLGRVPFAEFAQSYLERVTALQKSARTERNRVRMWAQHFGHRLLGQISRVEIEDWQRRKLETVRPATVNRYLCRLRHMFNKAVEWELLAESPMRRLKFLPENNTRLRYLSLEECKRLIWACAQPHLRTIVTIALHTGMRLGEILNLKRSDLDFSSGLIIIRDSKNGEPRHLPMDSTVAALLANYPPGSNGYLFPGPNGGPLGSIKHSFRTALRRAGISDLHFHDLRHTFASQWMMNGGDLYLLKDILGHKSIAMTQRYAHLSPAYKRAMVERMDKIWLKPGGERDAEEAKAEPGKAEGKPPAR